MERLTTVVEKLLIDTMTEKILAFLVRYPHQSFKTKELSRRLSLRTTQDYQVFKEALGLLVRDNKVNRIKGGRFGHLAIPSSAVGVFQMTKQGFGTVIVEGRDETVSIAPRYRGMAVDGDTVEVSLFAQSSERIEKGERPEGEIVKILRRGRVDVVGTLDRSRDFYIVVPDDRKIARDVFIDREYPEQRQTGRQSGCEDRIVGRRPPQPGGPHC